MTVVHKYVIKELLKYFCMVLASVVVIYLTVDFFGRIDEFLEAKVSLSRALLFFALKTPLILTQVMPVGVLMAVLIAFGLMVRNNEVVALQTGGLSIWYLFKPVFAMGLIFSILLFFFGNSVVPISMGRANDIWQGEVKKRLAISSRKKNIWIKGHRSISHITYFMPSDEAIFGVTLHYFDKSFRLIKRMDAEKGTYMDGKWHLFNVVEQNLLEDDGNYEVKSWEERAADLEFAPEDLGKLSKKPEEMTYDELSTYVREVEQEGYDATSYRVDLRAKIAFPLVCIIMSIVGAGLTFWRKRKEGLAGSIFYGIVTAFLYWTVHSFCLSLGYGSMLSPIVAAWLANGIFTCFGIFALLNAD